MADPLDGERWKVIQGNCLAVLPTLAPGSVDAIVSDPPYGVGYAKWDVAMPEQSFFERCYAVSRGPVLWFGAAMTTAMRGLLGFEPPPDRIVIWHVTFALNRARKDGLRFTWHPLAVWRPSDAEGADHFSVPCEGNHWWDHPATKPLALMRQLIATFTKSGDFVLDPFCGSGTTGVACMLEGRRFLGIEIDAGYCEIARRRIADAAAQGDLFHEAAGA